MRDRPTELALGLAEAVWGPERAAEISPKAQAALEAFAEAVILYRKANTEET